MKERAPRNRTLIVHEDEKMALMSQTVSLKAPCTPEEIDGKLIRCLKCHKCGHSIAEAEKKL